MALVTERKLLLGLVAQTSVTTQQCQLVLQSAKVLGDINAAHICTSRPIACVVSLYFPPVPSVFTEGGGTSNR